MSQATAFGHPVWAMNKGVAASDGQMQSFYQQVLNRKLQLNEMYVRKINDPIYRNPHDQSNNSSSYSSSSSKNLSELKTEIFRSLPSVIRHQKDCIKNKACKLNKLLLDYFIHSELERM